MKPIYTSATHPIELAFLTSDMLKQPGRIALSVAPGKRDEESEQIWQRDLRTDLDRLQSEYSIDRWVCLLEAAELQQLEIPDLLTKVEDRGIRPAHLPIPDEGLPESMEAFSAVVGEVVKAVSVGETVLIHCKGGRGRTGLLAAAVLVQLGYPPDAAISLVRQVRAGALSVALKQDYVYRFHTVQTS